MDAGEARRRFLALVGVDEEDFLAGGVVGKKHRTSAVHRERLVLGGVLRQSLGWSIAAVREALGPKVSNSYLFNVYGRTKPPEEWGPNAEIVRLVVLGEIGGIEMDIDDVFDEMSREPLVEDSCPSETQIRHACADIRDGWSDNRREDRREQSRARIQELADIIRPAVLDGLDESEYL